MPLLAVTVSAANCARLPSQLCVIGSQRAVSTVSNSSTQLSSNSPLVVLPPAPLALVPFSVALEPPAPLVAVVAVELTVAPSEEVPVVAPPPVLLDEPDALAESPPLV